MSFPVARRLSHSLADISIELIKVDITGVVVGVFTLLLRRIWFFSISITDSLDRIVIRIK